MYKLIYITFYKEILTLEMDLLISIIRHICIVK